MLEREVRWSAGQSSFSTLALSLRLEAIACRRSDKNKTWTIYRWQNPPQVRHNHHFALHVRNGGEPLFVTDEHRAAGKHSEGALGAFLCFRDGNNYRPE